MSTVLFPILCSSKHPLVIITLYKMCSSIQLPDTLLLFCVNPCAFMGLWTEPAVGPALLRQNVLCYRPVHRTPHKPYKPLFPPGSPWGPGKPPGGFPRTTRTPWYQGTSKYWLWAMFFCAVRVCGVFPMLPVPRALCSGRSRSRRVLSLVAYWGWKLCGGASGRSQSVLLILDGGHLPVVEWVKWKKKILSMQ